MRPTFELAMFACEPRIELFEAIQLVSIYFKSLPIIKKRICISRENAKCYFKIYCISIGIFVTTFARKCLTIACIRFSKCLSAENGGKCVEVRRPLIMSYPRYCRYKACLKRLENVEQKLHNEILIYLLGRSFMQNLPCEEKDIYFCRETTTLPDLKHFKDELSHLGIFFIFMQKPF